MASIVSSPTSSVERPSVVCSAPGKVLLAGGYLVLEPPNVGLTVATSAKFHTIAEWERAPVTPVANTLSTDEPVLTVHVHSPQFGTTNVYEIRPSQRDTTQDPLGAIVVRDLSTERGETKRNPYVESSLMYCASVCLLQGHADTLFPKPVGASRDILKLTVQADNSFYSHRDELQKRGWPSNTESLRRLPAFRPLKVVAKTGLGSSAALVTSFVGGFMSAIGAVDLPQAATEHERARAVDDLELVHRLAQVAHVIAQGKVGSGFDVCSACFGSNVYVSYSRNILKGMLDSGDVGVPPLSEVQSVIIDGKDLWDFQSKPFSLPPGIHMALGDVSAGSSTPSMVRAVRAWRQKCASQYESGETSHDVGQEVWSKLGNWNKMIEAQIEKLHEFASHYAAVYNLTLEVCSKMVGHDWGVDQSRDVDTSHGTDAIALSDNMKKTLQSMCTIDNGGTLHIESSYSIVRSLVRLRNLFLCARRDLKAMGAAAGVPIEPDEQTTLSTRTMNEVPGVLSCSVPGAGGHDAVVAIVLSEAALYAVEVFWAQAGAGKVCMLPLEAGRMYDGLIVSPRE